MTAGFRNTQGGKQESQPRTGPTYVVLCLTGILSLTLYPAFHRLGLRPSIDWDSFLLPYWVGCGFRAICGAALLYALGDSPISSIVTRYRRSKPRIGVLLCLVSVLWFVCRDWILWVAAVIVSIAVFEAVDRSNEGQFSLRSAAQAVFPAAFLLFATIILVFGYIDLIISARYFATGDEFFSKLDRVLLAGRTVSQVVHAVVPILPLWVYRFLESIYFSLYGFIGAGVIIVGLSSGRFRALQLVATISAAYYMTLLLYWLVPSVGPFYLCSRHAADFPHQLATYRGQLAMVDYLKTAASTHGLSRIGVDYFIAFPSMHIVQPVIVAYYLRGWRKALPWMIAYIMVLVAAILLLEWHYVVDLIGGLIIAVVAVNLVARSSSGERSREIKLAAGNIRLGINAD